MSFDKNKEASDRGVFSGLRDLIRRFRSDRSGNYLIIMAIATPAMVGAAGLGTEEGVWLYQHHKAQSAADAAAISAATAYGVSTTSDLTTNARSVAAQYGFANGSAFNNISVAVNRPPTSGTHKTNTSAVEVIVNEYQPRMLSAIFGGGNVHIQARAVALSAAGVGCVLSLDKTASGAQSVQGTPALTLNGCSDFDNSSSPTALSLGGSATMTAMSVAVVGNIYGASHITATKGIMTGVSSATDPYAARSYPSYSGCNYNSASEKGKVTLSPGVYCNGLTINASANVTFSPGTYYFDRGTFSVNGNATMSGTHVTFVFTSSTGSNYATFSINGGATVYLTAPNSGALSGLVVFGDRNIPVGTSFSLGGGANQSFVGAVYLPTANVSYYGGAGATGSTASPCIQLIGDTITFVGNSSLQVNCSGYGTSTIGIQTAGLAE